MYQKTVWLFFVLLTLALSFGNNVASAQQAFERNLERLDQGERRRRVEQENQARRQTRERMRPKGDEDVEKVEGPLKEKACIDVKRVVVDGVTLISKKTLRNAVRPFENRCLGIQSLNAVLGRVTRLYIEAGYSTSRAFIPEQTLEGGIFMLVVVEGKVGAIRSVEKHKIYVKNIFPGLTERFFNLRDFEQGLDQLNRLPSNSAKIEIFPGDKAGYSVVVVGSEPGRRFHGSIGVDNSGQDLTGKYIASVSGSFDNPLGINDQVTASVRINPDAKPKEKLYVAWSAGYSIPYGYWTARFDGNGYRTVGIVDQVGSSRYAVVNYENTVNAVLERVVYRSQKSTASVHLSGSWRLKRSLINTTLLQVSSYQRFYGELGADFSTILAGNLLTMNASVTQGVKSLLNFVDRNGKLRRRPVNFPESGFTKVQLGTSIERVVQLSGLQVRATVSAQGQYSPHILYSGDVFQIGGPYSVRGFKLNSLTGRTGFYLRSELSVLNLVELVGSGKSGFSVVPFVGLDYGRIIDDAHYDGGQLSGWTAGLNLAFRNNISARLTYSEGITFPVEFKENLSTEKERVFDFSLTASY